MCILPDFRSVASELVIKARTGHATRTKPLPGLLLNSLRCLMLCQRSELVTALRAPCDAERGALVEQQCRRTINISQAMLVLLSPGLCLLSPFRQREEAPRFHVEPRKFSR